MADDINLASTSFCVVIPAYNEGHTVGKVAAKVRDAFPTALVAVINDGSTDNTAYEAGQAGAFVVNLPFNAGYGVAFQTGLIWAKRQDASLVVTLDADGQHDPSDIANLLAPVLAGTADLALGSRYLGGSSCYRVPLARRIGAWLFAKTVSVLARKTITDPTSGFQCMNSRVLTLYASLPDFPEKTPDADLILYAHFNGCHITEVPVAMYADEGNDSMHGFFKSIFYTPKMLVAIVGIVLTKLAGKDA